MKERDVKLDLVRAVAILLVIWIHCQEAIPIENHGYISFFMYLLGRFGVPFFLMQSGILLLPRTDLSMSGFYVKKLLPLYVSAAVWLFLYRFAPADMGPVSMFNNIAYSALLVPSAKHTWYFSCIITVYLLMPLLQKLREASTRDVIIIFCLFLCWDAVCIVLRFFGHSPESSFLVRYALYYNYYLCFVIGGYLLYDRKILAGLSSVFIAGLFLASLVLCYLVYGFLTVHHAGFDPWWYDVPTIILSSLLACELLLRLGGHIGTKAAQLSMAYISRISYGIFTLHIFFLNILYDGLFSKSGSSLRIIFLFMLTFIASAAASAMIGRIPIMKKLVLR